jgi:PKD repeat protein
VSALAAAICCSAVRVEAETIYVAAGASLQAALNAAQPGDTILLAEGAEFVGNFVLPAKAGDQWITVRSAAPDPVLPAAGVRIQPAHAPLLARLRSPNTAAALRTAPGAHHWAVRYLEFAANLSGHGDIIQIGDGSSAQNTLSAVPHHLVLSHLYIHGDPLWGQKRGIALNAAHVTISDSHISECKGVGQDTQAIGGWNGPGPYLIENNYLEAAGENVLFGGADPAIPYLVADGITVRRNYMSRPMQWRNPILGTPQNVTAAVEAGGSLPAGSYSYRVVARGLVGQGTTGRSTASAEVTVSTAAAGSAVRVRWAAVANATEYRVYGRAAGGQNVYWVLTATEFVDTGAAGTAENVPTTPGTVWSVKNVFELKNARNVVVEDNILENHWKESQAGYAIVLTPRNSNGTCSWCIVENVRFEYNLVRNVAAGINLTGYDIPSRPTLQSNDIAFRHNLFTGMTTSLGGNAWFMLIGDEPRNVAIEHNTIDANGTTVLNVYGGTSTDPREIYGFRMVANAARHGSYGINGSFFSYGNGILNGFFPGAEFDSNYLAGGSSSRYPAGNLFAGLLQDQFVSPPADFTVRDGSILKQAAPDGSDVGADYAALVSRLEGVESGVTPAAPAKLSGPTPDFTAACTYLECVFTDASAPGSAAITAWTWNFGDASESAGRQLSHAYAAGGTYTVTLFVTDANGLSAAVDKAVAVEAPVQPSAALSVTCADLTCVFADASTAGSGAITSTAWNFGDGHVRSEASGTHVYAAAGTYTITLTIVDSLGLTSSASHAVTVEPPNTAPAAAFVSACTDLVCTFSDTSVDADGRVVSSVWTIDGVAAAGTTVSRAFAAPGTYPVSLTVTDEDGATSTAAGTVDVTSLVHASVVNGSTARWSSRGNSGTFYWSADVTIGIHGADDRPIAGATVTVAWSGAVNKTVTCVTTAAGLCTFKSGTLSMHRGTVTLTVMNVAAPQAVYEPASNHGFTGNAGTAITYVRP